MSEQKDETTQPILLRISEAAKLMGVSRGTLYRLASEGRLPVIRVTAGCLRVPRAELLKQLESETESAFRGYVE